MAIDINELEITRQKEAEEEQKRQDELISEQNLKKLEALIDKHIQINHTRKKLWFSKKTKVGAKFYFWRLDDVEKKIDVLIRRNLISAFFERYRQRGWVVRYWYDSQYGADYLWLSFTKIIDIANHEPAAGVNRELTTAVKNKREQLIALKNQATQIQLEIHQLEAEIQFLTESPNGRDPLLLPASTSARSESSETRRASLGGPETAGE